MHPQVGQLIHNKYRLVRMIGEGGMGSVWEAKHELLGTSVALKFLHGQLAKRGGLVERFLQEAQVSARIKSPHVVTVSDVDRTADGLAFMVMELIEGKSLQAHYEELFEKGERLGYGEAFEIMLQLCDGVTAAHRLDIVHRDLKPDNVMLIKDTRGQTLVKILDFGIAKLKTSGEMDRGLTRPGVVMGTPEYMAPEQAFSADQADARADVFSLGVMFYEMLSGRRPVGGDTAHGIAAQYLEGAVPYLKELKPTIAEGLAKAVHKAMGPQPADRFESVDAMLEAIEPFAPEGAARHGAAKHDVRASLSSSMSEGNAPALADTADQTAAAAEARREITKTVPPDAPPAATGVTGATPLPAGSGAFGSTAPLAPVGMATPRGTQLGDGAPPFSAHAGAGPVGGPSTMGMPVAATPGASGAAYPQPGAYGPAMGGGHPMHGSPPAPTRPQKRSSMVGIVAIAGGFTALVLGGLFVAQRLHGDESTPSVTPTRARGEATGAPADAPGAVDSPLTPPPEPPPADVLTPSDPRSPASGATSAGTGTPARPTAPPGPTSTGVPTSAPTSGPGPNPWVLPTALPEIPGLAPEFPKIPGLSFPGASPTKPQEPPPPAPTSTGSGRRFPRIRVP